MCLRNMCIYAINSVKCYGHEKHTYACIYKCNQIHTISRTFVLILNHVGGVRMCVFRLFLIPIINRHRRRCHCASSSIIIMFLVSLCFFSHFGPCILFDSFRRRRRRLFRMVVCLFCIIILCIWSSVNGIFNHLLTTVQHATVLMILSTYCFAFNVLQTKSKKFREMRNNTNRTAKSKSKPKWNKWNKNRAVHWVICTTSFKQEIRHHTNDCGFECIWHLGAPVCVCVCTFALLILFLLLFYCNCSTLGLR